MDIANSTLSWQTILILVALPGIFTAIFAGGIAWATVWLAAKAARAAREAVHTAQDTMRALIFERYNARWNSSEMRERRAVLAKYILERMSSPLLHINDRHIEDICSFFEELAIYVKKGLVDDGMVWEMLSEYAVFYWTGVVEDYARGENEIDEHDVWYSNYNWLFHRMVELGKQNNENVGRFREPQAIREFLELEVRMHHF